MKNKILLALLLTVGSLTLGLMLPKTASAHISGPPYGEYYGHPRPTSYVCQRTVSEVTSGVLPSGKRYRTFQYGVSGDDYANAHYNEAGSVIANTETACTANWLAGALWDGSGTINPSLYTLDDIAPEDVWLGSAVGYNTGPPANIGIPLAPGRNRGPANIRGIADSSNGSHFAEVNDATAININGQKLLCVGISAFFGPCLGNDAQLGEPLGCDCWGYLTNPDYPGLVSPTAAAVLNKNLSAVGRLGLSKTGNVVNPFTLTMLAMNTQDDGSYGARPGPSMASFANTRITFIYPEVPPITGCVDGVSTAGIACPAAMDNNPLARCSQISGGVSESGYTGNTPHKIVISVGGPLGQGFPSFSTNSYKDSQQRGPDRRWSTTEIANYKDAYSQTLYIYFYARGTGAPKAHAPIQIGPCAPPSCSMTLSSATPEPGETYNGYLGVVDNRASKGRPLNYNYSISLPGNPTARTGGPLDIAGNPQTPTYTANAPNAAGSYVAGGNVTPSPGGSAVNCGGNLELVVARRPYFRVYGGDVIAGGGFGQEPCTYTKADAKIEGFSSLSPSGYWRGAGAQLGLSALGQIDGVFSAGMHNAVAGANAVPRVGLTFGNYGAGPGYVGDYGGLNSEARCIPNLFNDKPAGATVLPANSTITSRVISTPTTYYVDGDVNLTGNITIDPGPWSSVSQIPSFRLIVKGNINIAPTVRRLDGIYFAQEGTIDTCKAATATPATCGDNGAGIINKLTVYGAFVAKSVKLNRTNGTVSAVSVANEPRGSLNIAEEFVYTPNLFLTNPDGQAIGGPKIKKYNSIVGLPPVL